MKYSGRYLLIVSLLKAKLIKEGNFSFAILVGLCVLLLFSTFSGRNLSGIIALDALLSLCKNECFAGDARSRNWEWSEGINKIGFLLFQPCFQKGK